MNTVPAAQFKSNDLLLKMYEVIVAHHEVSMFTAESLIRHAKAGVKDHFVREVFFSQFGENTENPMYLSYESDVWIEPGYDIDTFVDEPGYQNPVPYIMTINHITFYEDEDEMGRHRKEMELKAMADNAKFNYLTHNN
jgi:hypothetical protein